MIKHTYTYPYPARGVGAKVGSRLLGGWVDSKVDLAFSSSNVYFYYLFPVYKQQKKISFEPLKSGDFNW